MGPAALALHESRSNYLVPSPPSSSLVQSADPSLPSSVVLALVLALALALDESGGTSASARMSAKRRGMAFRSLAHLIDLDWLREAYRRTRKDGARGVDGQSAQEYQANLEGNLRSLLDRAKSGMYRAPPVRRGPNPKGGGAGGRPPGLPTLRGKGPQHAGRL